MQSFHQPQHAQLRQLVESSCAPPPPSVISYFNQKTNETLVYSTEVKVHEIGVLFDYEIRHASGVSWGEAKTKGSGKGWVEKTTDFFGNLFGGGDDEKEGEDDGGDAGEDNDAHSEELLELEEYMASEIWGSVLEDGGMTWDGETCMGLIIEDDKRRHRRRGRRRLEGDSEEYYYYAADEAEQEDTVDGVEQDLLDVVDAVDEVEDAVDEVEDAVDEIPENGEAAPIVQEVFTGTKLLGLTYEPLDYVNFDGCTVPDPTCTAIRGQVSVAYAGPNEYGVIQTVIEYLRDGMEKGEFIPKDSPALNVDFVRAGGTAPVSGGGKVIGIKQEKPEEPAEEESYLSRYGVLFVCLVAILGTGFIASMYVRYKKRQRRIKAMNEEGFEMGEEDFEANLALREEEEDVTKTEAEGNSSRTESPAVGIPVSDSPVEDGSPDGVVIDPTEGPIIDQVELEVPPVDSGVESNEIEISLSASKSWR